MLRLRPVLLEDESAALAAHDSMKADNFAFLLAYNETLTWDRYVETLDGHRCGRDLVEGWVASTFLLAVVGSTIVGRVSIRHELSDYLAAVGGHIGYGVLPQFRRLGYATEMLRQSLIIARSLGIQRVLVTCDDGNVASARTIERCGGVFESTVANSTEGGMARRYWID